MGLIRLILAIAVLLQHSPRGIFGPFIPAPLAVQCFYAISGFLIQMVLRDVDVHRPSERRRFYMSRLLRIYPLYLMFVVLTLLLTPNAFLELYISTRNWVAIVVWLLNNLLIVGQDVLRFFYYNMTTMQFLRQPGEAQRAAIHDVSGGMTILGQSWTLALELYFYLLAPFVLKRKTIVLVVLIVLFTGLRFLLGMRGHFQSEWYYGFFPSELPIFLLGSLAYRFYQWGFESNGLARLFSRHAVSIFSGIAVVSICSVYLCADVSHIPIWHWNVRPIGAPLEYWMILMATILVLPFAFHLSKLVPWDRFLGELSFPVYLSHFLIIQLIENSLTHGIIGEQYIGLLVSVIALLISIVLVVMVERPIDKLRHAWFSPSTGLHTDLVYSA